MASCKSGLNINRHKHSDYLYSDTNQNNAVIVCYFLSNCNLSIFETQCITCSQRIFSDVFLQSEEEVMAHFVLSFVIPKLLAFVSVKAML